ncbi:MAG: Fe-S cluster assembly protein SufD [Bacteroidetes bacterium GWA2_30_7]|nr:MAG: Fe-S cluster assembly protein SufD [Bacteroidetes bacterium GWA2_30_7]
MPEVVEKKDIMSTYLKLFNENIDKISVASSPIINKFRNSAIQDFEKKDIPSKKNENYKYLDLKTAFDNKYNYYFNQSRIQVNLDEVFRCDVPEMDTESIILINGWYGDKINKLQKIEGKAIIGSLLEAAKQYPDLFEKYYSKSKNLEKESLVSLNTAFAADGIFFYVPDNVVLEKPIQIINLLISEEDTFAQPRNLFVIGKNSQAKIIICDHTLSASKFLSNSVLEVFQEENSVFDIYNLQNEHNGASKVASVFFNQNTKSKLLSNIITLHGGVVRNNVYVNIDGEHCESNLYGLYLSDKWQNVDNYTYISHNKPNCTSNQFYKGILDDASIGAFNGKIYVSRDAQKTSAYQANNNILLTNDAKINSKPQLEIYADDVKCSHGATSGQIDENALFYLRSRGISEKEARFLLLYAFTNEIIKEIKVEVLRDRINNLVDKRLRGELTRCNSCVINCC